MEDLTEFGTYLGVKRHEKLDGIVEKQIEELRKILTTKRLKKKDAARIQTEVDALENKRRELLDLLFSNLSEHDRVILSRHDRRPQTLDFIKGLTDQYIELHGDRLSGDDQAIIGCIGVIDGKPLMIIGHQKGNDLQTRQKYRFGIAHPEGYRKSLRLMKLAEKFGWPILVLIDTRNAASDLAAEKHGISRAIAHSMFEMTEINTAILSIIIAEGGSGGAIALGVADTILMLEHAIYAVIPPEGCANILRPKQMDDPAQKEKAIQESARDLKLTSHHALELNLIDGIIPEPYGGAHRDPSTMINTVKSIVAENLTRLMAIPKDELLENRFNRFRHMGVYNEIQEPKEGT